MGKRCSSSHRSRATAKEVYASSEVEATSEEGSVYAGEPARGGQIVRGNVGMFGTREICGRERDAFVAAATTTATARTVVGGKLEKMGEDEREWVVGER